MATCIVVLAVVFWIRMDVSGISLGQNDVSELLLMSSLIFIGWSLIDFVGILLCPSQWFHFIFLTIQCFVDFCYCCFKKKRERKKKEA